VQRVLRAAVAAAGPAARGHPPQGGSGRPGVRASLLGTVRRADGELQETYGGWPVYLWIGDTGPGQATGQADDMGLWYVLSVTGAVDRGTPR
jgi:predicted lipoprotein with Yx(FWY)xxD motif